VFPHLARSLLANFSWAARASGAAVSKTGPVGQVGRQEDEKRTPGVQSRRSSVLARVQLACWLTAFALPAASASVAGGFDPIGAWHLTVHYQDQDQEERGEARGRSETGAWVDRVWRFEWRGSRLQWTEFATVVFDSQEGRFETGTDGRSVRVPGNWSPNEAQLAQIARGPLVNPRGSRSKGLRGSGRQGYSSAGGLRAESASVIGYSESWSIEGLEGLPVFTQDASMGSGRTESVQGRTRYSTEWLSEDGRELRGRFERDGLESGRFVLRRAGEPVVMGGATGGSGR
jgi:hypothetical protein